MIYAIPPRNPKGKDLVAYWDDFLKPEHIDLILQMPEWNNLADGVVGGQNDPNTAANRPEIRTSQIAWMHLNESNAGLWDVISKVVAEVNSQFFQFDLTGMYEPMQLSLYDSEKINQGHYTWHTDMSMMDRHVPRKLSMSLLLSDPSEFEGGEFEVKTDSDIPINLEQKRGRAWFFPSWALHRVTPVTKGVRKSLVLWVGGPPFK
jgi:PKHD-type hydroxylase